jgi:hypothetical protein
MARTLLVVPTASGASLARTCLGVVRALDRQGVNVGFVKPVAQPRDDGGPDRSAALVRATTALHPPEPLSTDQLEWQLGSGGLDVVLEKAVAAWQPVHHQYDVVVVEGLSPGPSSCTRADSTRRWPERSTPTSCWPPAGRRSPQRPAVTGERARLSLGHPRPRIPLGVWPNGSPSRPAGTSRVSTNA